MVKGKQQIKKKKIVRVTEEEELVVTDFQGLIPGSGSFTERIQNAELFNLKSNQPMIKMGNQFFQGSFKQSMGTNVLLSVQEQEFTRKLTLDGKTDTCIRMKRVFLDRTEDGGDGNGDVTLATGDATDSTNKTGSQTNT